MTIFKVRFIEMSNHFKSVGLFCWAAWCAFSRPCRPVLQFSAEFSTFSCCFQNVSISSQPISHWLRFFFVFCSCRQNGNGPHFHFFSPLCECVAGSQIGHLLCKDCKFLIRVRRCHATRITRKASPPCVPAGKTVQWTIFVKGTYRVVTKCDYSLSLRCKETK